MLTLFAAVALAQTPALQGTWATPGMSIDLGADGQVTWQLGNQVAQGSWTVTDDVLRIEVGGAATLYRFALQGDVLQIVDARGVGAVLQRQAPTPAVAAPQGPELPPEQVLELLEDYATLDPSEVWSRLHRLPSNVEEMLGFYGALTEDLWLRVCAGPQAAGVTYGGGCPTLMANRQQMLQLYAQMGMTDDGGQARIDAANVATWYRCQTGALDGGTCSTWLQVQSNASQMQHETSMQIIENMGNNGCTEYFEEGTNRYLGCW